MLKDMILAARLDRDFYERIEHDPSADGRTRGLVLVIATMSAAGAAVFASENGPAPATTVFVFRFLSVWLGWLVWAGVSLGIGTSLTAGNKTESDYGELKRVLAFAFTPLLLSALIFVPAAGPVLFMIGAVWTLVAGTVAIGQALDFSIGRAIVTVVAGWIVMMAMFIVFTLLAAAAGFGLNRLGG